METILNTEFRLDLLNEYFSKNTLYLGLWSSNTIPTSNETLISFENYELNYAEYNRITIPKFDWIIDEIEVSAYLNKVLYFNPLLQNWTVDGYFICSSNKLIEVVEFPNPVTVNAGQYLTISPKIYCGGTSLVINNNVTSEEVYYDYIANGDYYASQPTLILATGSSGYIIPYIAYGYHYAGIPVEFLANGNI